MKDKDKTKEQLVNELKETRQRVAVLEASKAKDSQTKTVQLVLEEDYENIFNLSPDMVGVFTTEGALIKVNRSWERILGYRSEELLKIGWTKLVHPDDMEETNREVEEQLKGSPVVNFINRYKCKDSSYKTLEWQATFAKEGIVYATARDITERKQAEEIIRHRLELEKSISSISSKFIGIYDIDKAINASLGEMSILSGASRAYLFLFRETGIIMDNSHEWCAEGVSPQKDNLKNLPCDMFPWWMIKLHQGETIHITDVSKMPSAANVEKEILESQDIKSLLVLPVFIGRELNGFIGFDNVVATGEWDDGDLMILRVSSEIIGNALQHKRTEEREKQLHQELNLASRLATVGQMSSGIAHEINNPLTGVIGFSDLLLQKDLPEDIRKDVNIINEGATRIASITKRMLVFARQHKQERTRVNINNIIETTLAMRSYEMESTDIKVTSQLASDIPLTFADAGQLQQVFLNIVLNAEVEMTLAHGKGNLSIKTERIDNDIRVSFKDDGPGIPKKNLDRLFDPFFTTRDPDKGTGLGLSICYSIVTQHNGKIYAQSRLGKGATFFVELPIVTKEEQLEFAKPEAKELKKLSKAKILVVDDDTIVQQFLTEILAKEGHEVIIVENGDDALERIETEDYDVILLDVKLPGMNGIELYKYMQKSDQSLSGKVIFVTGDTMSKGTTDFLAKTRAPYITKPFNAKQLKSEMGHILSQQP